MSYSQPHPQLFPANDGTDLNSRPDETIGALDEVRASLAKLKDDIAALTQDKLGMIGETVEAGAETARSEIRRAPGTSIAIALALGALVGIAVTTRRAAEPTWQDRAQRARDTLIADYEGLVERARQAGQAAQSTASGFVPAVERLAQSLSQIDAGQTLQPAIDKGTSFLRSVWTSLTKPA